MESPLKFWMETSRHPVDARYVIGASKHRRYKFLRTGSLRCADNRPENCSAKSESYLTVLPSTTFLRNPSGIESRAVGSSALTCLGAFGRLHFDGRPGSLSRPASREWSRETRAISMPCVIGIWSRRVESRDGRVRDSFADRSADRRQQKVLLLGRGGPSHRSGPQDRGRYRS